MVLLMLLAPVQSVIQRSTPLFVVLLRGIFVVWSVVSMDVGYNALRDRLDRGAMVFMCWSWSFGGVNHARMVE